MLANFAKILLKVQSCCMFLNLTKAEEELVDSVANGIKLETIVYKIVSMK